ncbi:MAG: O-antigen ligase family protein [bacterium]|nr:O-antigen ligase family protein [bacterium]
MNATPPSKSARVLEVSLWALLALTTLGEGGAEATSMLAWHGVLLLLLLFALAAPSSIGGGRLARAPAAAIGLFVALVWVGALFAPYKFAAWLSLLELLAFCAVLRLSAGLRPGALSRAGVPLLVLAALQSLWVVAQSIFGETPRPAGTFLNTNHLSAWLGAILFLVLGSRLERPRAERGGVWWLALAAPVALAIVLSGSRGWLLGLAAGGVYLVLAGRRSARLAALLRRGFGGRATITAAVAVVIVAAIVVPRLIEVDPYRYHRTKIWRASMQTVLRSPWLGSGPKQFGVEAKGLQFPDGELPLRYDRFFSATHSDALRVPCELGWPGALAALLVVGVALRSLRRSAAEEPPPGSRGAIAALLALAAQGLVENLSQRPAVYILAAFLAGIVLARAPLKRVGWGPGLRLSLALLLALVYVVGDVAPYAAWRAAQGLPRPGLDQSQAARLARALRFNPLHPDLHVRRAETLSSDAASWGVDAYAAARRSAERAVSLSPRDPANHRALARVEAQACRTLFLDVASRERAFEAYERARRLAPTDPTIDLELAAFLIDTGDAVRARRAAERALATEPEAALPRLVLADALIESLGELAHDRSRSLLDDAERKAHEWSEWSHENSYAGRMLTLDSQQLGRIRAKLPPVTVTARGD